MLHKTDIWEVSLQLHGILQVLASRVCAAQLGLIYAADKAVSLQHSTLWGTLGETTFQFISDSTRTLQGFQSSQEHKSTPEVRSHPLSRLRGCSDLASFSTRIIASRLQCC